MAALASSDQNWAADVQSDDDVPAKAAPVEAASESESEDEGDGGDLLLVKKAKAEPAKKGNAVSNKNLSKKEKEALKKKELDEMDDIFNEMGITLEAAPTAADSANVEAIQADADSDAKDKKKKKKTKTANKTKTPAAEAPAEAEEAPLSKEEIKARLVAKQAALAKKASSVPDSVKEAMKEKKEKKKVYGNYDL